MVVSVATMVVYLIVVHDPWERSSGGLDRGQARMFNATTVITLMVGTLSFHIALFALTFGSGLEESVRDDAYSYHPERHTGEERT